MNRIRVNNKLTERGVTLLETAITLPLLILLVIAIYDLGRIYTTVVFCQDTSLMAAKLAVAADPLADTPSTANLIKTAPNEKAGTTNGRSQAWTNFLNIVRAQATGKTAFTERELKTLNLAYGYLNSLNRNVAFPIPENATIEDRFDLQAISLAGVTNCSITFVYDQTVWGTETDSNSKHRRFSTICALPLTSSSLFGALFSESGYLFIERSAYAYQSGPAT